MKRDRSIDISLAALGAGSLARMTMAIVGGTGGIGRALAHVFAAKGAHVLVVGQTFRDQAVPNIDFMKADLGLMREAERVAVELPAEILDIVVFTTGIMAGPEREVTAEGIERDLAVSYLSRFVILERIASRLGTAREGSVMRPRAFVVGFPGSGQTANVDDLNSELSYGRIRAHSNTVAGNEVLVLDVAERFPAIDVFGLNPGFVKTGIRSNVFGSKRLIAVIEWLTGFMMLEPEVYAERLAPLLVARGLSGRSGAMFDNKAKAILPSVKSTEPAYSRALMEASAALVARADGPGRAQRDSA